MQVVKSQGTSEVVEAVYANLGTAGKGDKDIGGVSGNEGWDWMVGGGR